MKSVKQFLEEQDAIIKKDREKTLVELGLTEKVCSPENKKSPEYPKYEYKNGQKVYYKTVAIDVTDEEYELIITKANQVKAIREKGKNTKAARKLTPLFKSGTKNSDNSRKLAKIYRIFAILAAIAATIVGIAYGIMMDFFPITLAGIAAGALMTIAPLAAANLLESNAELLSILHEGGVYTEEKQV